MNILIVGNITKDVYLNLDTRTEALETDGAATKWLNLAFNASEHHFFNRSSNFGGAAVSLEVLQKMGLSSSISGSKLNFLDDTPQDDNKSYTHRYILIADGDVSYFSPSKFQNTPFVAPAEAVDYLYIDRSANLNLAAINQIKAYLSLSPKTRLILYVTPSTYPSLTPLLPEAHLIFFENHREDSEKSYALASQNLPSKKVISISENQLSFLNVTEPISVKRIDTLTHLSAYSIVAATLLGAFILGTSIEKSFKMARANVENTKINSTLSLAELQTIAGTYHSSNPLELIAASLVLKGKGILAADESGGSIQKKFAKLGIPDTYENRRDYRNLFFTTDDLEKYVSGVILFDETAHQIADDGQNFVQYLTKKRIIPGIKVDQGLAPLSDLLPDLTNTTETYTKGLDGLKARLQAYYQMGLRFTKWRAAFTIQLSPSGEILTPTDFAITKNCQILAEYAATVQAAGLVPIVEPEVVYDGDYSLAENATITARILDTLFQNLRTQNVNLKACLLKVNMVMAGKQQAVQSTPEEVGQATATLLKAHVPQDLAGVVFLSGGQTPEQATENLAAIIKNGPFPWPVTFSFARALQDPALYAWAGDNANAAAARAAFKARLQANAAALRTNPSQK